MPSPSPSLQGFVCSQCLANSRNASRAYATSRPPRIPTGKGRTPPQHGPDTSSPEASSPSLMDELFPTPAAPPPVRRAQIPPRLPVKAAQRKPVGSPVRRLETKPWHFKFRTDSPAQKELRRKYAESMQQTGSQISVLYLRQASPNLVEDDFRRLVPQGKHLEGWTVESADLLQVIPERSMADLKPNGCYFLTFPSQFHALNYQTFAVRVANVVAGHTPKSVESPLSPPPGHIIHGMDAHEAIQTFTLVPASQRLELISLKPPYPPLVWALIHSQGYGPLVSRPDRMPYELRMTMVGPQLSTNTIRNVIRRTYRSLGTEDSRTPHFSKWEPVVDSPHMWAAGSQAKNIADRARTRSWTAGQVDQEAKDDAENAADRPTRQAPNVHILGFENERDMHMFRIAWHGQPLTASMPTSSSTAETYEDTPPTVHLDVLW